MTDALLFLHACVTWWVLVGDLSFEQHRWAYLPEGVI